MRTAVARHLAALMAAAGVALAVPATAQDKKPDKTVKIGVLNDMSSLYADIGGPNSVAAIKMAVEDSGLPTKGWKIDVLSGDHQNKPDVGVNIARQWIDSDKVDVIADTPNSGVALAVSNVVKEKNAILLNSGRRHRRPDRQGLHAEHDLLHLRHLHARQRHRQGADQGRRRQLVLPDRGLRVRRMRWNATPPRSSRPMAARCSAASSIRSTPRTSRPSCCRRRRRRRRWSDLPMPAATPPTRSSRPPNSASSPAARSSRRCCSSSTTCIRSG